jgi:hypothetical protein
MKLNSCNLLLTHMVYLYPKHILLLAAFTQQHDTHIQVNDTKHMAQPLGNPLLTTPLDDSS